MATDGGLSPGSRFDRIELTLGRIEDKLDLKADVTSVDEVKRRVVALESAETPLAKIMLEQFVTVQNQVADLVLHGSAHAQAANTRLTELESEIGRLDNARNNLIALQKEQLRRTEMRVRTFNVLIGLASVGGLILGAVALFHG